ncbi:MAG: methyltransferase [Candidatus Altiarchaeota archaeon]|nr:methyltransferase [Candidatus Altiarchaeota archaeon]
MSIYFKDLLLDVEGGVYQPAEDSFLLAENLDVREGDKVLDLGTGSGIQALTAASTASWVLGVDVNPKAVEVASANARLNRIRNVEFRASDLFGSVPERFDLIIFNPPYLPTDDDVIDMALDGGDKGVEVILRFIGEAQAHLNSCGRIQFIISSINNVKAVENALSKDFRFRYAAEKKLFFEKLFVVEAELKH